MKKKILELSLPDHRCLLLTAIRISSKPLDPNIKLIISATDEEESNRAFIRNLLWKRGSRYSSLALTQAVTPQASKRLTSSNTTSPSEEI
jgi:hypothetical protein